MAEFKVGDVVVHKSGKYPLQITEIRRGGNYLELKYLTEYNGVELRHRSAGEYITIHNSYDMNWYKLVGAKPMAKVSYTVLEDNTVGSYVGTNSAGQIVLEFEQPSGGVLLRTFNKEKVEKVRPYVIRLISNYNNTTNYYETKKGLFKAGDIIKLQGSPILYTVTAVHLERWDGGKPEQLKLPVRRVVTEEVGGEE